MPRTRASPHVACARHAACCMCMLHVPTNIRSHIHHHISISYAHTMFFILFVAPDLIVCDDSIGGGHGIDPIHAHMHISTYIHIHTHDIHNDGDDAMDGRGCMRVYACQRCRVFCCDRVMGWDMMGCDGIMMHVLRGDVIHMRCHVLCCCVCCTHMNPSSPTLVIGLVAFNRVRRSYALSPCSISARHTSMSHAMTMYVMHGRRVSSMMGRLAQQHMYPLLETVTPATSHSPHTASSICCASCRNNSNSHNPSTECCSVQAGPRMCVCVLDAVCMM